MPCEPVDRRRVEAGVRTQQAWHDLLLEAEVLLEQSEVVLVLGAGAAASC